MKRRSRHPGLRPYRFIGHVLPPLAATRSSTFLDVSWEEIYPLGALTRRSKLGDKDETMTTDEARALVAGAKTIEDVLGSGHDDASLRLFRRLVHPDRCDGDETAWAKLERLASGTTSDTAAAATAPAAFSPLEIRTRSRTYALTGLLAHMAVLRASPVIERVKQILPVGRDVHAACGMFAGPSAATSTYNPDESETT